jgi:hypothetical protein
MVRNAVRSVDGRLVGVAKSFFYCFGCFLWRFCAILFVLFVHD